MTAATRPAAAAAMLPFMAVSNEERERRLRHSGMWSPVSGSLSGVDAFDVRRNVDMLSAAETASQLLLMLAGTLETLSIDIELETSQRDAISAALFMARLSGGMVAVLEAGASQLHRSGLASVADSGGV